MPRAPYLLQSTLPEHAPDAVDAAFDRLIDDVTRSHPSSIARDGAHAESCRPGGSQASRAEASRPNPVSLDPVPHQPVLHEPVLPAAAWREDWGSLSAGRSVNRRDFLSGGLATGFAAAVAPHGTLLAQTQSTDSAGLIAGDVAIPSAGIQIPAYRAMPAGRTAAPVILVVHEIFGVHEHIRDVCRRFAKAGWMAIAPELFVRQGDVRPLSSIAEIFAQVVSKVPDSQVLSDLDAVAAWAGQQGGRTDRIGVTGFCWGGRVTWLYAAHSPQVKAGVAWYGRLTGPVDANNPRHPHDVAEVLKAPVLGLYGGQDSGIPLTTVEEMKLRLSFGGDASKASDFVVYPDAPHAFHADYRPSYRKEAAEDAWQRCLDWFRRHGVATGA